MRGLGHQDSCLIHVAGFMFTGSTLWPRAHVWLPLLSTSLKGVVSLNLSAQDYRVINIARFVFTGRGTALQSIANMSALCGQVPSTIDLWLSLTGFRTRFPGG